MVRRPDPRSAHAPASHPLTGIAQEQAPQQPPPLAITKNRLGADFTTATPAGPVIPGWPHGNYAAWPSRLGPGATTTRSQAPPDLLVPKTAPAAAAGRPLPRCQGVTDADGGPSWSNG